MLSEVRTPGSSAAAAADPASAADSITAWGAHGTPAATKQRFSRARCWQTATASATPGTVYITDGIRHLGAARVTGSTGRIDRLAYDVATERWR